jgi:signal transduction histidine kinase
MLQRSNVATLKCFNAPTLKYFNAQMLQRSNAPILKCINLSKDFGTLSALQGLDFSVHAGEVVGVAGRSGAGKTVLARLLAGLTAPSAGEILFQGQSLRAPFNTQRIGIGIIHQRTDLADNLDVTANMFLGGEIGWPAQSHWLKIPNRRRMDAEARRLLERLDVHIGSLRQKVVNLSGEQRQMLAIARAMTRPARLLVIDDPTAMLGYSYQQRLLALIREWQQQGIGVVFCSNNLDHLFAATDRILVLRQGRQVADLRSDSTSRAEVVAALVGTSDHQQLTPIIWALDNYQRAREQAERLRQNQRMLEQDMATRDSLSRELIDQLAEQVVALDSANLALQHAQRRLLSEREQERKALARELHDQVIQDLLSVNYQLEDIANENGIINDELGEVSTHIRSLIDDVRRICGNLRPPTLDSLGLGAAIRSFSRDWSLRSGVRVDLDIDPNLGRLPEPIELSIFRIVQEGLSNVRKHAQASVVHIHLRHSSPRSLLIELADNGRGIAHPPELSSLAANGHYGLLGISERVALLEGRLRILPSPGGGLLLQAEVPHPRVELAQHGV